MKKVFEIKVYGQYFENIESVGGWQVAVRCFTRKAAEKALKSLIDSYGENNVDYNW